MKKVITYGLGLILSISTATALTPNEAMLGDNPVVIERCSSEKCTACNGTGKFRCNTCNGTGKVDDETCSGCNGAGDFVCDTCNGTGEIGE